MRFNIHITHHFPVIEEKLEEHSKLLATIIQKQNKMSQELENLKSVVAAENTVIDSAIALLNGLSAQIAALKPDQAAIAQLASDVAAKTTELADAVTANTQP